MLNLVKLCASVTTVSCRSSAVIPSSCLASRLNLHTSSALCGEPLKKKRRHDPSMVKMQIDRRKKRLEKRIRQVSRFARKLKPVDEFELHRQIPKGSSLRKLAPEVQVKDEEIRRHEVTVEWATYRNSQTLDIHRKFSEMLRAQELALHELKLENPALYDQAVQKDENLILCAFVGPTETPPISNYVQDGQYKETTKSYELNPEIVKLMLAKNTGTGKKRRKSED